jgi:hypothetical protein
LNNLRHGDAGLSAFDREGQKSDRSGFLDGSGELPLMPGAVPGNPAGEDLAPVGNISFEASDVLVFDVFHFIDTEVTHFSTSRKSFFHHIL